MRFYGTWLSVLFNAEGQMLVWPAIGLSKSASCWQWAAYATVSDSPVTKSHSGHVCNHEKKPTILICVY